MTFRNGQKVEIFRKSDDESWEEYMNELIGLHGIVTDPDAVKNDPDALIEVSLDEKGTHRLPQDCLRAVTSLGASPGGLTRRGPEYKKAER